MELFIRSNVGRWANLSQEIYPSTLAFQCQVERQNGGSKLVIEQSPANLNSLYAIEYLTALAHEAIEINQNISTLYSKN
ncbi:MAG: hypothetical protein EZS28_048182, partial [Streblomastix strix]